MKLFLKYPFVLLLLMTCLVVLPYGIGWLVGSRDLSGGGLSAAGAAEAADFPGAEAVSPPELPLQPDSGVGEQEEASGTDGLVGVTAPEDEGTEFEPEAEPIETEPVIVKTIGPVPEGYFDDALFIGDSRTVGICEYGGLSADFFASVGMSVYSVLNEKVAVSGIGEVTLTALLDSRQYGKIYIMLGINELGYNYDATVAQYAAVVEEIRAHAPEALIIIEANLHVSGKKSNSDKIFTNANIDRFNTAISQLADSETVFYLDVNPVFDDGEGNLGSEYTGDGVHIYAKHYTLWAGWLRENGVVEALVEGDGV